MKAEKKLKITPIPLERAIEEAIQLGRKEVVDKLKDALDNSAYYNHRIGRVAEIIEEFE